MGEDLGTTGKTMPAPQLSDDAHKLWLSLSASGIDTHRFELGYFHWHSEDRDLLEELDRAGFINLAVNMYTGYASATMLFRARVIDQLYPELKKRVKR